MPNRTALLITSISPVSRPGWSRRRSTTATRQGKSITPWRSAAAGLLFYPRRTRSRLAGEPAGRASLPGASLPMAARPGDRRPLRRPDRGGAGARRGYPNPIRREAPSAIFYLRQHRAGERRHPYGRQPRLDAGRRRVAALELGPDDVVLPGSSMSHLGSFSFGRLPASPAASGSSSRAASIRSKSCPCSEAKGRPWGLHDPGRLDAAGPRTRRHQGRFLVDPDLPLGRWDKVPAELEQELEEIYGQPDR